MTPRELFPDLRCVLVVVAHPDDESFGLGAVLDVLAQRGAEVSVLCFTHGEASTLHGDVPDPRTLGGSGATPPEGLVEERPAEQQAHGDRQDRDNPSWLHGEIARRVLLVSV